MSTVLWHWTRHNKEQSGLQNNCPRTLIMHSILKVQGTHGSRPYYYCIFNYTDSDKWLSLNVERNTRVTFIDENIHSTKSILLLKSQVSVTVMHVVSVVGVAGWPVILTGWTAGWWRVTVGMVSQPAADVEGYRCTCAGRGDGHQCSLDGGHSSSF